MPYVGKEPVRGQNRELDDISGSFNGGNTAFTMQVGGINTAAGSANQVFISLGGVMQNPGTDFTVASSTITFTTPPANGLDFWGLIQGDAVDINTPADGSVTSSKIASGNLTLPGDVTIPDKIVHDGDTNTAIRFPAADTVSIETGGSERARVDSSGNVGINESTSNMVNGKLTVKIDTDKHIGFNGAQGEVGNVPALVAYQDNASLQSLGFRGVDIRFADASSERLRVKSGGDVEIKTGNLVIGTAGKGIDFSVNAHQSGMNSELLDGYEEGTFTPNWRGGSTAGTTTYTANGSHASYTKIGRLVNVGGYVDIQSATGTGPLMIDNLPFAAGSGDALLRTGSFFSNNVNYESDHMWLVTYTSGGTNMKIYGTRDAQSWEPLDVVTGAFIWSLTYAAAA